jgi:hypothetical protein
VTGWLTRQIEQLNPVINVDARAAEQAFNNKQTLELIVADLKSAGL